MIQSGGALADCRGMKKPYGMTIKVLGTLITCAGVGNLRFSNCNPALINFPTQ